MFGFIRKRLARTILTVLTLSVATVMAVIIYLTVSHQTKDMVKEIVLSSEEQARIIVESLRYTMAIGDSPAMERQLLEIRDHGGPDIFICAYDQKISFATEKDTVTLPMAAVIPDRPFLETLDASLKTGLQPPQASQKNIGGKQYITTIHPVLNNPQCYGCHGSERKVLGGIIVSKNAEKNYGAIARLRNKNILISIAGLFIIAIIIYIVLSKLISQPLLTFREKIKELTLKIREGDYSMRLDVRHPDEIGGLILSFNEMAEALERENRSLMKAHEDIAYANQELEAFAYSVSHDLRAPLRGIEGFSKILLDDYSQKIEAQCQHYLNRIRANTLKMSSLIDDMLTLSKAGRTELQKRPVDIQGIVKNALNDFRPEIEARGITIAFGNIPVLDCDQKLMQVALSNLISNAIKFTRNGMDSKIEIGFDDEKKAIFVRDNGIGFDMEYHEKIFGVFQRLHLPEEYEGTGIGLAIVKRIVERHAGKVWAESESGKGATFFITIPFGG
ncbi:MAG TPA: ATP-binding protein [Thermodesulfovibrionales bacterium]|nr:ATP-binding protein [Thermodesulfovibrionales bacterium]